MSQTYEFLQRLSVHLLTTKNIFKEKMNNVYSIY